MYLVVANGITGLSFNYLFMFLERINEKYDTASNPQFFTPSSSWRRPKPAIFLCWLYFFLLELFSVTLLCTNLCHLLFISFQKRDYIFCNTIKLFAVEWYEVFKWQSSVVSIMEKELLIE